VHGVVDQRFGPKSLEARLSKTILTTWSPLDAGPETIPGTNPWKMNIKNDDEDLTWLL
jgi:hypothetical protein